MEELGICVCSVRIGVAKLLARRPPNAVTPARRPRVQRSPRRKPALRYGFELQTRSCRPLLIRSSTCGIEACDVDLLAVLLVILGGRTPPEAGVTYPRLVEVAWTPGTLGSEAET